ncbi:MAG TPA: large conductance mechanosensitive channel protein MscL [Rhizomicrobium sp.]|jgi:large conductance mechanosensitive channel|nr:large conductance mechanosensitive channel protein MscL [Rhizomicrobium sp.]
MFQEFRKFAMRGNVIDLAVGVVVGAAFTAIINSMVKDVLTPPLGWVTGGLDFTNLFFVLKGPHPATLAEAQKLGAITINYGVFINAIIQFLIVAVVLFLLLHQFNRLKTPDPAIPAATPEDIQLLREIRDLLKERT